MSHIFLKPMFRGRMRRSSLFLVAILSALVAGCEQGMFCTRCGEAEPCEPCRPPKLCKSCRPPKPPAKIDWTGLSDELQKLKLGGDVTINAEGGQFVLKPGEDAWKVEITNWDALTGKLQEILLAEPQPAATHNYWIWGPPASSIPPPVKLCPSPEEQELRIFVFFPHEAQLSVWASNGYEKNCTSESPSPVCPEFTLFEAPIEGFIRALANCPGEQPSLQVLGFASSSSIENANERDIGKLEDYFSLDNNGRKTKSCKRARENLDRTNVRDVSKETEIFNLLVAELRASNVADMLMQAAEDEKVKIDVHPVVWCSYEDMALERKVEDFDRIKGYDSLKGVLNRRVEIRVVAP